jgi:hypothetical protein
MFGFSETLVPGTDASQCGNDRPRFGLPAVTQKLRGCNIIRVLNIIKLNYIIVYDINIAYSFKIIIFIIL